MHGWIRYIHVAISLFVISDPLGAIPLFLAITKEQTTKETARAAIATAATVAMVLTLTVFLGRPLLRVFGIRIASFRVGGGILILMMAIAMLYARPDRTTAQEAAEATGKRSRGRAAGRSVDRGTGRYQQCHPLCSAVGKLVRQVCTHRAHLTPRNFRLDLTPIGPAD